MDAKRLEEIRWNLKHLRAWVGGRFVDDLVDRGAAEDLLAYIDALKVENARMRHDLDTTDGLYASDKEDMSHSFRIEHASLRHKPEA